jgi:hypothetical protein
VAAKSTGIRGDQQTIADSALKAFVLDVVNADKTKIDDGKMYFFSRYPAFFPTKDRDIEAVVSMAGHNPAMFEKMKQEWPAIYHRGLMWELHEGLRGVWQAEDESAAGRLLFGLQSVFHRQMDISGRSDKSLPPPSHPIQQALLWVQQHLSKLRRCRNVKCPGPRPFFVADTKEEFCSNKVCSHEGEKASKRRWWEKNKQERRRKPGEG